MGKKRRVLIGIPLLALLVVISFACYRVAGGAVRHGEGILISGNIEVVDAELSFKINGRVVERTVDEGDLVEAGKVVARLDNTELTQEVARREAEVALAEAFLAELQAGARPQELGEAEAAVQLAQARLDELLAGSRPQEIAVAQADVASAKAEAERLKIDETRSRNLFAAEAVSAHQDDAARAAATVARERLRASEERLKLVLEGPRKEQVEQARAALRQAQERHALVVEGPRAEDIAQARAKLDQAKAALGLAEAQLANTVLVSAMAGVVLSKNTEPGEYVAPGTPVVTVGNLSHVYLRAYINEQDLGRVKLGQAVEVTTDTYPGKTYPGVVAFIAPQAEFTPKSVQTAKERVKLVYRVKIDIENPNVELKPGMPADGVVRTASS